MKMDPVSDAIKKKKAALAVTISIEPKEAETDKSKELAPDAPEVDPDKDGASGVIDATGHDESTELYPELAKDMEMSGKAPKSLMAHAAMMSKKKT